MVDAVQLRGLLLAKMGLRIEPEMSRYLAARLEQANAPVAILAGDGRTGAPVRRFILPTDILNTPLGVVST